MRTAADVRELPATDASTSEAIKKRLLSSDRSALADLYDLYHRKIYGLALWWSGSVEEAEDIVQETFVRVWEKRHLVGRARELEAYLLRIAKTIAIGRGRKRRPTESIEDHPLVLAVGPDPERQAEAARLSDRLRTLSPKLRTAVYLRGFLGYSFRQTGSILGVPTFTAASRYRLAIQRLRQLMESKDV